MIHALHMDPAKEEVYMANLRTSFEKGVAEGVEASGTYFGYLANAVHIIKMWLSRDGFLERSIYDEWAPRFRDVMK